MAQTSLATKQPPVAVAATAAGRVQSMRSRFENLTSLDALDIDRNTAATARRPDRLNLLPTTNPPKFRRSVTSFELLKPTRIATTTNNNSNTNVLSNKKPIVTATKPILVSAHHQPRLQLQAKTTASKMPVEKSSAPFKVANRRLEAVVAIGGGGAPLTEITENVQSSGSKLSRHTSDPIKRGSIKRSPAFRVGGGGGGTEKPVRPKLSSPLPNEQEQQQQQEHQSYQGFTDTLKAALRQPLPTGPPPKKPPRAFSTESTPSPQENVSTLQMFVPPRLNSATAAIKPSLFGGCIPCVSSVTPIYDAVKLYSDEPPTIGSSHPSEHIYMEPYGHLKMLPAIDVANGHHLHRQQQQHEISDCSAATDDSLGKMCACPATDHSADSSDLHYLVSCEESLLRKKSSN